MGNNMCSNEEPGCESFSIIINNYQQLNNRKYL